MKRKLLYVGSTYGHICSFHLPYLLAFHELGWEVHVACGGEKKEIPYADCVFHVPFHKEMSFGKNWQALQEMRRIIKNNDYALMSTHTALASCFARLALFGLKEPPKIACMVHGYLFDEKTPLGKRVILSGAERFLAAKTDLLMTMNQWDDQYARKHALGQNIVFLPGIGVPFQHFNPEEKTTSGAKLRKELGLSPDKFAFIYAAEFSARKDQQTLIRAMSQLPEGSVLFLPGEGDNLQKCKYLAQELNLQQRIFFPGRVQSMGEWYSASDAAVSSSRSEGLPFNLMEAMFMGLPIVASAVKGNEDLIQDGLTGLLFPFGDEDACAKQMHFLMTEKEKAFAMAERAREKVSAYDLHHVLPLVMECYQTLLPLEEEKEKAFI